MEPKHVALRRYVAKHFRLVTGEKYYVRNVCYSDVSKVMLFCMYHKDPTKAVYSFYVVNGILYGTLRGNLEYDITFDLHNHDAFLDQLHKLIKLKRHKI